MLAVFSRKRKFDKIIFYSESILRQIVKSDWRHIMQLLISSKTIPLPRDKPSGHDSKSTKTLPSGQTGSQKSHSRDIKFTNVSINSDTI